MVPAPNSDGHVKLKRRNRVSTICHSCRDRRLKCDRQRPFCGRCVLDHCTQSCHYEEESNHESPTSNTTIMSEMKISKLNSKIKELEDTVAYQRNLLEQARKTNLHLSSNSSGEFPVLTLENSQEKLSKFHGFAVYDANIVYLEPTSYKSTMMEDQDLFKMTSEMAEQFSKMACNNKADTTDSVFPHKLPPIKDIDLLLYAFFHLCHPFVLFFKQDQILSQLHHLLDDHVSHSTINQSKFDQSSLIAILLILLRFAYISLSSDSPILGPLLEEFKFNESYIDCALSLLMAPDSFKNLKIEKVKGLLLLRIYKMYCRESDDTTYSTSIINSTMVQSARVLGLHRVGSNFPQDLLNGEEKRVWSELWEYISFLDSTYSFDQGLIPTVHLSEVVPSTSIKPRGEFQTMGYLMRSSAIVFTEFLNGPISQRKFDFNNVTKLLNDISHILLYNTRTFQQLLNNDSFNADASKRACEFMFRLDLTYKEFVLLFMLYLNLDGTKKEEFLSKAFERCLILVRVLHQMLVEKKSFFGLQLDRLILPRTLLGTRFVSFIIMKVSYNVLEGKFSILNSLKYFNSPDSTGLIQWANVCFQNEQETLINILKRFAEICAESSQLTLKLYACFKLCLFMQVSLEYIIQNYPYIADAMRDDSLWRSSIPFEQVAQMWKRKHDLSEYTYIDSSFTGLNDNLEIFFEGLGEPDWLQNLGLDANAE